MEEEKTIAEISLISQTKRDKLLTKLREFETDAAAQKIAEEQREKAACLERRKIALQRDFAALFVELSKNRNWYQKRLRELEGEDLQELAHMLYEQRSRLGTVAGVLAALAMPIFGWLFLGFGLHEVYGAGKAARGCTLFTNWAYARRYRQLRKLYGEDFIPMREVRRELNP